MHSFPLFFTGYLLLRGNQCKVCHQIDIMGRHEEGMPRGRTTAVLVAA
jgi:hypothetical protein